MWQIYLFFFGTSSGYSNYFLVNSVPLKTSGVSILFFHLTCNLFKCELHLIRSRKKIRLISNFVRFYMVGLNDDGFRPQKSHFNNELEKKTHQAFNHWKSEFWSEIEQIKLYDCGWLFSFSEQVNVSKKFGTNRHISVLTHAQKDITFAQRHNKQSLFVRSFMKFVYLFIFYVEDAHARGQTLARSFMLTRKKKDERCP